MPPKKGGCGSKASCALGVLLAMLTSLAVGLAVGLFVGQSIGKRSSHSECPSPTPDATTFNWGDKANINGQEVNVLDWFDDIMTEENIKKNLE